MNKLTCHICGSDTGWCCRDCDEPVCEACCVPFTLQNQIDFNLCEICHDGNEARRSMECWKEEERQDKLKNERELKSKRRRELYRKPENIIKRRERSQARKKVKMELREKQMKATIKIISDAFGGMF